MKPGTSAPSIPLQKISPVRDTSAKLVSQSRRVHIPIGEPKAPVQIAKPAAAESVNSSEAESDPGEDEMVTRQTMTIGRFMPSAWPALQQ